MFFGKLAILGHTVKPDILHTCHSYCGMCEEGAGGGVHRPCRSLQLLVWNSLMLNTRKTEEMVIDFRRSKPPLQQANIRGEDIEVVQSYRYLWVHLDSKLDWSVNTDADLGKGQSRLRSFDVRGEMLHMFFQSVVVSTIFYAAVRWGGSATECDREGHQMA